MQTDKSGYRFSPDELLTWQQITSFWSGYNHKLKNPDQHISEVTVERGEITEVQSDLYVTEENLETDDQLITKTSRYVNKNL